MNEKQLKQKLVSEVDSVTATEFSVRTDGGDTDVSEDLPVAVIDASSRRVRDHGHSTHAEYIKDNSGNEIGERHVLTLLAEVNITIKSDSESQRDGAADNIQKNFMLYEGDTEAFDTDVYLFEVGDIRPRKLQNVEPDWYQNGMLFNIKYCKYVDDMSDDTLETVNRNIDVQEDL
jgi:hypothetical protein